MALRKAPVAVRFGQGIDTKTDPKQVPATKLLTLENGVFTRGISIKKRNGYADISRAIDGSTGLVTNPKWLAARGDELLAFTAEHSYSLQPSVSGSPLWNDAGSVYSVVGSDEPAVDTGSDQTAPDHATSNGIRVYAWEDSRGGVWWSVVDGSTGRVCRAPEQLDAAGQRPRCCAVGSMLHVYWANPSAQAIKLVVCNPARPSAVASPMLLVQDLNASNPVYDAEPTTYAGSPVLMAWAQEGSTNARIGFVDATGVLGSPETGLPQVHTETMTLGSASPISVTSYRGGNASKVALTVQTSTDLRTYYYGFTTVGAATSFSLAATVVWDAASRDVRRLASTMLDTQDGAGGQIVWVAAEVADPSFTDPSQRTVEMCQVNAGLGTASSMRTLLSVGLASRAFWIDGQPLATFVHDTTYFNTYLVLRLTDWIPAARILPGLGAGLGARSHLPSAQVDGSTISLALPCRERLISENNDKFTETSMRRVSLDFDNVISHQAAQLGRGLYLAGACPMHYDGHGWNELGFHVGPELIATTPDSGGSLTSSLEYEYIAWYEWPDAQGEIHRGPTSVGTVITLGGSDTQVTLTLPPLRVTQKQNVRIGVARCRGNDSSAFYRVTSLDPATAGQPNGYLASDPTVQTVTFVDRMADSDLIKQEPLYTNGGILSNDPTALGPAVTTGKNRLFFTDPSDGNVIHYSQELDVGYGVEIPPDLKLRCDPYGGSINALAVMDDQVYAFKDAAIFVFGGDGPLANGDSSETGFSTPQLVTSDVGCTDPSSVVLTPVGLMFKSAKGVYLIDRSKTVSYVGAEAEAYNGQTIRRATLMNDRTQVVFLTDSGLTLLYDYYFRQWSTFTNHQGYDAMVVGGSYYYVRTDGRIFKETPGVYSDGGLPIKLRLETAWIKMLPYLQGWQRFYHLHLIGEWDSAHQMVVQVQTDYTPHWSDPAILDMTNAASSVGWITGGGAVIIGLEPIGGSNYGDNPYGSGPYGGTPPTTYQARMHLGLVGQAIRFRFEDYQASGNLGASYQLSEILLTGGVKGIAKKPFSAGRST
jgi:hypothetical protein